MREPRPLYDNMPTDTRLEVALPTGPLPGIHDGEPVQYAYSEQQRFAPEKSEIAFTQLLVEQGTDVMTTRQRRGPHQDVFTDFMVKLQARLHAIDPLLTPEHLAGANYQSSEARRKVATLTESQTTALTELKERRIVMLGRVADELFPQIGGQLLHPDTVDDPPYYPTKHDWGSADASNGCANACFRMIFGGIARETPSQTALSTQLIKKYGTSIVHDEVLTNLLKTPAFKDTYGKQVHTVEYIGADLEHIQKAAQLVKSHRPESRVYCLINLGSASEPTFIWHTGVLLAADEQRVVYHDPSGTTGGPYHALSKEHFLTRWAQTYNRAKLVIST